MANNLFRYRNYKHGTACSLRRRRYKQGIVIHLLSFLPAYKTTPVTTREERWRKRHPAGRVRVRRLA